MPSPINKYSSRRQHIKQPLRKHRQLKQLLKPPQSQQKHSGKQPLHHQRIRRALKPRMHLAKPRKEQPVPRRSKRNARSRHHRPIQRHKDAQRHPRRHQRRTRGPSHHPQRSHRRPRRSRNPRRRQNILDRRIRRHKQRAHHKQSANQRQRQIPLRLLHLARHHRQIVPAVISPKRSDQRNHKAFQTTSSMGQGSSKIPPRPQRRREAEPHHHQNQNSLQHRKHHLEIPSLLDPQIIQSRHQPRHRNRKQLRPHHRQRPAHSLRIQPVKGRKNPQRPRQSTGHRSNRSRLGHGKPRPHIKKTRAIPISPTQVDILAARKGHHRPQLGISHRPKKRKQPTHNPRQIHQPRRPHRRHHLARHKKYPAANNRPHHNRQRMTAPQHAWQILMGPFRYRRRGRGFRGQLAHK